MRQTDGANVLLIDEVVLGDEDGQVIGDPLCVIVRVYPDSDHLCLLSVDQFILRLDIVLPAPGVELSVVGVDLVPQVRGLALVPEENSYRMPCLSFYLHDPELVGHSQQLVWSNERSSSDVDSLSRDDPEQEESEPRQPVGGRLTCI